MLTEEECEKALFILNVLGEYEDGRPALLETEQPEEYAIIEQLIQEHFDNPPLKFEELKPNMLVYDKKFKFFFAIFEIHEEDKSIEIVIVDKQIPYFKVITLGTFEENRFYRKQVE